MEPSPLGILRICLMRVPHVWSISAHFLPSPGVCSASVMWRNGWVSKRGGCGITLQADGSRDCAPSSLALPRGKDYGSFGKRTSMNSSKRNAESDPGRRHASSESATPEMTRVEGGTRDGRDWPGNQEMAEREGFEPPIPVKVYTLSRRAPSATRPSLRTREFFTIILSGKLRLPISPAISLD